MNNSVIEHDLMAAPSNKPGEESRIPPLREKVYCYLKRQLNEGVLRPGAFLDQNAIGEDLGLSRTPLRDALLRLEAEGFVTIHPRRGVVINPLDIATIRNAYQILGSLEAAAIIEASSSFTPQDAARMEELNTHMGVALGRNDFSDYYESNLAFHEVYIGKSANGELKRLARILKERLYDFPRREGFLSDWEMASIEEHAHAATLLKRGDFQGAADYTRDVHWSFKEQERYIMAYYFAREAALGSNQ